MRYVRHKDNFYKIEKETLDGDNVIVEYSHCISDHLPNAKKQDNGSYKAVLHQNDWVTFKDINDLEYWIWRHIGGVGK
jgi:hypothetical protein